MTCKGQTDVRRIDVEPVDVRAVVLTAVVIVALVILQLGGLGVELTRKVTTPQTVGAPTSVALGIVRFMPQTRVGPHITVNVVLIATWTK